MAMSLQKSYEYVAFTHTFEASSSLILKKKIGFLTGIAHRYEDKLQEM